MNIHNNYPTWPNKNVMAIFLTVFLLFFWLVSNIFAGSPEDISSKNKLIITGSEFYQRSQFDAGEIRVFLRNTSKESISINQLTLYEFFSNTKEEKSYKAGMKVNYLCSKLSPPFLMPGQNGELLIKLLKIPPNKSEFKCTIYGNTALVSETLILVEQAPIWISYIGFSEDLSKVYVYSQNNTQMPLSIRLLEISGVNVGDNYRSINSSLPPGDKGCLVFKMSNRPTLGEYVHVALSSESNGQKFQTRRIVKAVNKFTLLSGGGSPNPKLGLDSKNFFVQTATCPAHSHDTHEEAAKEFLDGYNLRFSQNPYLLIQMWICRAGKPQAWYKFGPLPDVAVMNPILLSPRSYKSDTKASERFCPFFWLATTAKKATEPHRYLACIPIEPEGHVFLQNSHTSEEIKSMVYYAIAAGAKGILYRGTIPSDQLSYSMFVSLNRELQQLKPLLVIAEPVNWVSTADNNYEAKSLLCGDEAILVIVFDKRYFSEQQNGKFFTPAFGKTLRPVKIEVKVPNGFSVSKVKSIYATLPKKFWSCENNKLEFTSNMIDSVHIYKVILKCTDSMSSVEE